MTNLYYDPPEQSEDELVGVRTMVSNLHVFCEKPFTHKRALLEGYVLWFRNSLAPEELTTRFVADLPQDHREIVMDAYKTVKRERRTDETVFEPVDVPLSPAEIAKDDLWVKRFIAQQRREAIGNSARKALTVPGPFDRPRRDILMNR